MQLEPLPRRKFLKLGLMAGGVAVATLNGCASAVGSAIKVRRTPYGNLLVLNEDQARVFHGFVEAVIPKGEEFPDADEAEVVPRLDEELYFISSHIVDDMKLVLDALEWMPMAYGYFSRFSRLSPEKRLEFLNGTKDTGFDTVRAVINNCRLVGFYLYYGHESTWAAIGYDGTFAGGPQKLSAQRRHYAELAQAEPVKSGRGEG